MAHSSHSRYVLPPLCVRIADLSITFDPWTLLFSALVAAHYSSTSQSPTRSTHSLRRSSDAMSLDPNQPEVTLEGKRKQVLDDVSELFCSRPTIEIFKRSWRPDAVFEDPISKCLGYKEYAPQWFGMPKLFPKSITLSRRVISSTHNPNRIMYQQEQEYTVRGLGTKKVMKSLVVIELDENDMIVHLHDKWNGNDHPTRWGAHALRRLNAMTLPWFVSVPKLDKHD